MSARERSTSSWKRLNVTLCFELSLGKQIIAFKGAREESPCRVSAGRRMRAECRAPTEDERTEM
ncbi:hypothetical protein ACO22_07848 [Paracoccidioides brasiliensis]|uniref:Uncharacterized protein n=1 Tax=Paracoccidioides brasiliensis TaxID=121759 RepID=A0A1D2J3I0_PARBR|nr:hypothetical protein ACO22_07848 [Paracoccidioides brasiliensis]